MAIEDYLRSLKYNQLFGDGSFTPTQPPMGMSVMAPIGDDPSFIPQHQASDFMSNLMSQIPQRPNPGIMSKIVAGIAGLGDNPAPLQNQILYGDYNDKMNDWLKTFGAATTAATAERQNNTLAKSVADSKYKERIAQQRADSYEEGVRIRDNEQRSKEKTREAQIELAQKKQALAEFKAQNPNFIFKTDEHGMVIAINPHDPTKILNTGVNSGDLGDLEKHGLKLNEIEATGEQSRKTDAQRASEAKDLANLKEIIKPTTSRDKNVSTSTTKTDSEGNQITTTTSQVTKGANIKRVPMFGPDGSGPWMVPEDKIEDAKSRGMVTVKPKGK